MCPALGLKEAWWNWWCFGIQKVLYLRVRVRVRVSVRVTVRVKISIKIRVS